MAEADRKRLEAMAQRIGDLVKSELPDAKFVLLIGDERVTRDTIVCSNDDPRSLIEWLRRGLRYFSAN